MDRGTVEFQSMPDIDNQTDTESTAVDAGTPVENGNELPSLADAFKASASSTETIPEDQDDESEDTDDEDESTDAPEAKTDTVESDDQPRPKLSANERRRQAVQAAKDEAAASKAELETLRGDLTAQQLAAFQSLGDDTQFQQLHAKAEAAKTLGQDPEGWMDSDEWSAYQALHSKREHAFAFKTMADAVTIAEIRGGFADEAKALGIDPPSLPESSNARAFAQAALRAAVSATEARVKTAWAEEKARLEADNQSMTTKLASRQTPIGRGGRSDSTVRTKDAPDWDSASPSDFFAAAARQRESGARQ